MAANDGTVESDEVITEEFVLDTVERVAQENKVFREAYRQIDSTDANSNNVQVPQLGDRSDDAGTVAEGASITGATTDEEETTKTQISHSKYARAVEITRESVEDSKFDVMEIHAEAEAEALAGGMNNGAYTELNGNLNADSPVGTDGGPVTYGDLVTARRHLRDDGFTPNVLFLDPQAEADILQMDEFNRATDDDTEVIREAFIGSVLGMDVFVDNDGNLGANEAVLVDSNHYGYESVRRDLDSRSYEIEDEEKFVVQTTTRMGWKASQSGAAIKVTG